MHIKLTVRVLLTCHLQRGNNVVSAGALAVHSNNNIYLDNIYYRSNFYNEHYSRC